MNRKQLLKLTLLGAVLAVALQVEAGRIYYAGNYGNPNIWAWTGTSNVYPSWPGQTMTVLENELYYGRPVYYTDINWTDCPDSVIFNNNGGEQTISLHIPGYNYMFNGTAWMPFTTEKSWYVFGDLDGGLIWNYYQLQGTGSTLTCTINLLAGKEYYFKLASLKGASESNYSAGVALTRTTCTNVDFSTDGPNAALATTIAGTYVFTFDTLEKKLSVTYPDALAPEAINTTSVPAECGDVLIQAYYWAHEENDSTRWIPYGGIQWTDLNAQAAELGQYFDLVWLAPSAVTADYTGFLPINYSDQNNVWGTEAELKTLISNLHAAGSKVVADIVINHSNAAEGFCDWDPFNFGQYGIYNPNKGWVANDDEMYISASDDRYKRYDVPGYPQGMNAGMKEQAGECGNDPGIYSDENDYSCGETDVQCQWSYAEYNCVYSRDWSHKNKEVREMCRAYLIWMKEYIGYDGWRYDFAKGIHGSHLDDYNKASNAVFSVAEVFDGDINKEIGVLRDTKYNTYLFDFPAKYQVMNDGIRYGNYYKLLGNATSTMLYNYKRYTITFVDNHDTFREYYNLCGTPNSIGDSSKVIMANAYILAMPGVPCVFYPYWYEYKAQLKPMIEARRIAGVHSESNVVDEAGDGYYKATIEGKNGKIRLLLGPNSGYQYCPEGYTAAYVGTDNIYVGVYYTTEEQPAKPLFFLDTQDWGGSVNAYMWREDGFSNAQWPGAEMMAVGTFDGHTLFSYTHNDEYYSHVIFNRCSENDTVQTHDLTLAGHTLEKCYAPDTALNDSSWADWTDLRHTLDLNASKWTTFYLPLSVMLPDSVWAYYATTQEGDSLLMIETPTQEIPAYTPVLILGAQRTHELPVTGAYGTSERPDWENKNPFFLGTFTNSTFEPQPSDPTFFMMNDSLTAATNIPVMTPSWFVPAARTYFMHLDPLSVPQQIRFVFHGGKIPTDLGNVVSTDEVLKRIENGQLVIIREGVKYNALGTRIE